MENNSYVRFMRWPPQVLAMLPPSKRTVGIGMRIALAAISVWAILSIGRRIQAHRSYFYDENKPFKGMPGPFQVLTNSFPGSQSLVEMAQQLWPLIVSPETLGISTKLGRQVLVHSSTVLQQDEDPFL